MDEISFLLKMLCFGTPADYLCLVQSRGGVGGNVKKIWQRILIRRFVIRRDGSFRFRKTDAGNCLNGLSICSVASGISALRARDKR